MFDMKVRKKSPTEVQVEGTIRREEMEEGVNKELNRIKSRVEIHGFRRGKAPIEIIKARYGDNAKRKAVLELVERKVDEITQKENIKRITVSEVQWSEEGDGNITFTATFEIKPKFELKRYKGIEVSKPKVEVTEDDINRVLERIKEKNSYLVPVDKEKPGEDDWVAVDFRVTSVAGRVINERKNYEFWLKAPPEDLLKAVLDMKKGEKKSLHISGEKGELIVNILLKEIKRKVEPEISDELAKSEGFENLEELKREVERSIRQAKENALRERIRFECLRKIEEENEIPIPFSYLKAEARRIIESGNVPKTNEELTSLAFRNVLEELVLEYVAEKEGIKVEDSDIDEFFSSISKKHPHVVREKFEKRGLMDEVRKAIIKEKAWNVLEKSVTFQ